MMKDNRWHPHNYDYIKRFKNNVEDAFNFLRDNELVFDNNLNYLCVVPCSPELDKKYDEWIASVRAKSHIEIKL